MQDTLQPIHRLPFTDLGHHGVHAIAMNPVAPTVYIHVHQQVVDPLAAALAYWPWVLSPVAAVILAFTAWRTLRILPRRQRPGVPYCRRCNYDLSGATAERGIAPRETLAPAPVGHPSHEEHRGAEPSPQPSRLLKAAGQSEAEAQAPTPSCPECGHPVTPRSTLRGRSTRRRLVPLLIPVALTLGVVALGVALAAGWRPARVPRPSPSAQSLLDRLGITVPARFLANGSSIVEVDLATGTVLRSVVAAGPQFFFEFGVDPTGQSMIVGGENYSAIRRISTRSGRTLAEIDPGPPQMVQGRTAYAERPLCGFAPDGHGVYLQLPSTPDSTRVVRWSFDDGSITPIADLRTYAATPRGDWSRLADLIPVAPGTGVGTPARILSRPHFMEAYPTRTYKIGVHSGAGPPTLSADLGAGIDPTSQVAFSSDGSRFYLAGGMSSQLVAVDTADLSSLGTVPFPRTITGENVAIDPLGRLVAAGGFGGLAVRDTAARAWAARLALPTDLYGAGPAFSGDGRYVAASAQWGGGSALVHHELLIWDLADLRARLPTPAPPPAP
jgi:hypothetical protein